ncbi:hypothetical protein BKG82_27175 [Mycobacteroides chelonae]|uniref:Uncharacterized protein n=1 Tax=Mycobacteroides chelonae TaxID=1774 RepID=A0A1S1LI08_MYCCH|nr:hypothetical protein [Mycobacteroides chelonae]OHU47337.1 hypothetical protein BKG82_27175 [Mycobacteroides chelonae]
MSETAGDTTNAKMSLDDYMKLLTERMNEYMEPLQRKAVETAERLGRPVLPPLPPLLQWFIRDGDEDLVELPEPAAKRKPEPRYYRPASYWQERVTRIEEQMAATAQRADVGDPAAAGGYALGPKRTARHQKRADHALERYSALAKKLAHAQGMLRNAQARETKPIAPACRPPNTESLGART